MPRTTCGHQGNMQHPICVVWVIQISRLWTPHLQSDYKILWEFKCSSFQTGTLIATISDSFVKLVFVMNFPTLQEDRNILVPSLPLMIRRLWYHVPLRVAYMPAFSAASSTLLAPHLMHCRRLAAIVCFPSFSSPQGCPASLRVARSLASVIHQP